MGGYGVIMNKSGLNSAAIYVPVLPDFLNLAPGSAIVGTSRDEHDTRLFGEGLKLYYEGNIYAASNLHYSNERIICAAGRLFEKYPTTAISFLHHSRFDELRRVGTIYADYRIEITDTEAAEKWFSLYSEKYDG